jgi:hypothetical protein
MGITRLPAHTTDLEVTIVISKELRPYFTAWYQAAKIGNETPQAFALRHLKENARKWYVNEEFTKEVENYRISLDAISADEEAFDSELG